MATPLETAAQKVARPFDVEAIAVLGGENLDVSDASRPPHQFKSLRNFRIVRPGEITTRTGHTAYELASHAIPLSKCELVFWDTTGVSQEEHRFDVTLIYNPSTGTVSLYLLNKQTPETRYTILVSGGITDEPLADVIQYSSSLIVTIYGLGLWEVFNTEEDGTGLWEVRPLGKELAPLPATFSYAETATGDLWIYTSTRTSERQLEYTFEDDNGEPDFVRIPANVTYYSSESEDNFDIPVFKRWKFHKNNPSPESTARSAQNARTNAWGYKFVVVRKYRRANGQEIIVRSHPSVDMWVRDTVYCPPFALDYDGPGWRWPDKFRSTGSNMFSADGEAAWGVKVASYPETSPRDTAVTNIAIPSMDAIEKFRLELAKYMGVEDPGVGNETDTAIPPPGQEHMLFACAMAGYRMRPWETDLNGLALFRDIDLNSRKPYRMEVYASDLKRAPMVTFTWAHFLAGGLTDVSSVMEIEIYRTAYEEEEEMEREEENIDSALFQPHKYGYVGSIKPGGDFTDDTPDEEIAFSSSPDDFEGYLEGQLSGSLMREYGGKIALANTESVYWVFRPTEHAQAYLMDSDTGYALATMVPAADGFNATSFHYAYVDHDGNESDIQTLLPTGTLTGSFYSAVFVFPKGYAPAITGIKLYRSEYDTLTATRSYSLIAELSVEEEVYISDNTEVATPATPGRDTISNNEPGGVQYSNKDQPYHWPILNFERIHPFAPINAMEVLLGQLWIQTDQSTDITTLSKSGQERGEEETKHIGCIARRGYGKFDKVYVFLSQHGFFYMEPSGPVQVPNAHSEILKYIREEIPGQLALANARRATVGVLRRRNEIWLHFPTSRDLWPAGQEENALPHRTFVFNAIDGNVRALEEYEFDLTEDFEQLNEVLPVAELGSERYIDQTRYRNYRVLFSSHGDGTLYSSHYDSRNGKMIILAHDTQDDCPCAAGATLTLAKGNPAQMKHLESVDVRMRTDGKVHIATGFARSDGLFDQKRGHVSGRSRLWQFTVSPGKDLVYSHVIPPNGAERSSGVPHVRIYSEPSPERANAHRTTIKGITIKLFADH